MASFDLRLFFKRYRYPLAAAALIVCGVAARLALILTGWPHSNSEEGTMGLEAMHILQRGAHPIYLYGQNYMGVGEAYAGALAFKVFGISVASLRLGMIAFYALFMVGVFWLAGLLYSRRVALASLAALVLTTPFLGQIELRADGGKAETMAFGALMFAVASWLALTPPNTREAPRGRRALRYAAFVAWGLFAGLGLYTYTIIAPFVLTSGLLLCLACWRELRGWAVALPLVGLLIGLFPDIVYTARVPLTDNPVAVFLSLHHSLNAGGPPTSSLLPKQAVGTLLYTLPAVTGLIELYPVKALPLYGPPGSATVTAVIVGGGWSLAYLFLLGVATYRPSRALWQNWRLRRMRVLPAGDAQIGMRAQPAASPLARESEARSAARLLLALTAWLTIAAYMFSATAANNPHSGRYMIGLLVITPAILWPLVDRAPRIGSVKAASVAQDWRAIAGAAARIAGLALLCASLIFGARGVAQDVPNAVAANGRDAMLAHDLLSHGVTRFYSEYWTCDLLIFETRERLTCAVVNDYAQPGLTRYHPYYVAVHADKDAPYVLSRGSSYERTFLIYAARNHLTYTMERIGGRDVYFPTHI